MLGATFLHRPNMDPRSAEYSPHPPLSHQVHIKQEVLDHGLPSFSPYASRSKGVTSPLEGRNPYSSSHRGVNSAKNSGDTMSGTSYSSWSSSGRRPIQGDHGSSEEEAFGIVPQQYMNVSNPTFDKLYFSLKKLGPLFSQYARTFEFELKLLEHAISLADKHVHYNELQCISWCCRPWWPQYVLPWHGC